jgi:hypothetical protein
MLHLLFYLLLQLGLLEGPTTTQQPAQPVNQISTQSTDAVNLEPSNNLDGTTLETDTNIGGSGWDDKN